MAIALPQPIAGYFAADRQGQAEALSAGFTPDAVVIDEGNAHVGREAIRQWMADASAQYAYTVEPFAIAQAADRTIVTSHLVGNFPGSPVDLRYIFELAGGAIARLEIVPASPS